MGKEFVIYGVDELVNIIVRNSDFGCNIKLSIVDGNVYELLSFVMKKKIKDY